MMPQPRVGVYKSLLFTIVCCILVYHRTATTRCAITHTHTLGQASDDWVRRAPVRAVAMTCPSKPDKVQDPIITRWIHNPADPYLGISAVADVLVDMNFPYPMYVLSFSNEHDATLRCKEVKNESPHLEQLITCLELPSTLPRGYGYAKIDAMLFLSTNTDVDEVVFLDCDALPVSNLTEVFHMLATGAAWGEGMWRKNRLKRRTPSRASTDTSNGDTPGRVQSGSDTIRDTYAEDEYVTGDEVAAVFWADIEGNYDVDQKLIEDKYATLHGTDSPEGRNPIDHRKYHDSYNMKFGCDTGIMLVNLRRSQSALQLLLELKSDKAFQKASYGDKDLWRLAYYLTGTPFRLAPHVGALGTFDRNHRFMFASQAKHDDRGNIICVHQLWYPSRHELYYRSMINKKDADKPGHQAPLNAKHKNVPIANSKNGRKVSDLFDTFEGYYWDKLDPHPTKHLGARVHIRFSLAERPNYQSLYDNGSWIRWSKELTIDELSVTPNQVLVKVYTLADRWGYVDFTEYL